MSGSEPPDPRGRFTIAALLVLAADGAVRSCDAGFLALFDVPEEVARTRATIVEHLENRGDEVSSAAAEAIAATGAGSGAIEASDGRVVVWTRAPLDPGAPRTSAHVLAFADETGYRRVNAALRDAETWLRMFTAHTEGVVLEVDPDARLVGMWARDDRFLDVPESELRGRTFADVLGPDTGADMDARVKAVLATERPASFELAASVAGQRRVFDVHAVVLPRSEDEPVSATVLVRDVTERAQMRAELARAERLASIGMLAAGVAHEINNPLAYILLNLEHLRRGLDVAAGQAPGAPAPSWEELSSSIDMIREGAERVQGIVKDLQRFARGDDDERARVPVDVRKVLAFTLDMAAPELRHRAQVVRELGDIPDVAASEARLGQVFMNLVLNAAQAIPAGRPSEHEIRVTTSTDDRGRAVVEVRDTGVGIPKEMLPHVFDPFFSTKPPNLGTGLGLAISHGITRSLGGVISVESEPGRGAVFRVVLPPAAPCGTMPP